MALFEQNYQDARKQIAPLAHRMRPESLDEFVGQEDLLGEDRPLRIAIEEDTVSSCIFWDRRVAERQPWLISSRNAPRRILNL